MDLVKGLFAVLALSVCVAAHGAKTPERNAALVEAVQMPAWLERGSTRVPVRPGIRLRDSDRIVTGESARILLRLPEGSTVKLGEKASFGIDRQQLRGGALYAAAMNVAAGAFRFTTDAISGFRGRREVDVRFATVVAGIRGTDLWGKSAEDREIVCLIDGRIEVQRGKDAPIIMDQPLSFYIAPKDQPSLPVAPVPKGQLEQWSAETEIAQGKGAARRNGRWRVVVAALERREVALKIHDALRDAGYAAEIRRAKVSGLYEVRLTQFPSKEEAQALADTLRGRMGVGEAKVVR